MINFLKKLVVNKPNQDCCEVNIREIDEEKEVSCCDVKISEENQEANRVIETSRTND